MRIAVLLLAAAIATPALAQAPYHLPGEEAVDPYVASNANAGPRRVTDPSVLAAFHGQDGIRRVVNDLVETSIADPRISEIFKATDLVRLRRTLFEQFCYLMDGGCQYTGRDMASAHKDMGVQASDMNALVENLQRAMDKERVPFSAQNRLLAILAPMKRDVVER
jgi:hemoglobin